MWMKNCMLGQLWWWHEAREVSSAGASFQKYQKEIEIEGEKKKENHHSGTSVVSCHDSALIQRNMNKQQESKVRKDQLTHHCVSILNNSAEI